VAPAVQVNPLRVSSKFQLIPSEESNIFHCEGAVVVVLSIVILYFVTLIGVGILICNHSPTYVTSFIDIVNLIPL